MAQETQLMRTTFEYRETDGGGWEAWEANAENDIIGKGQTPMAAVARYATELEAMQDA
jgi:hypothetical protein